MFAYGIVSYSNGAKESLLGVNAETLQNNGAVKRSRWWRKWPTARCDLSGADIAVAVSGIAGPGGGSQEKPVGTVWFAWAVRHGAAARTDTEAYAI